MNEEGLVTLLSQNSVAETVDRLARLVVEKGLTVFARIDHAKNAVGVGLELRPSELLIFGSPRAGTPLMQESPTSGIDLPVKALTWQDQDGQVWLTYNDVGWLAERHGLRSSTETLGAIANGMDLVCRYATQKSG